MAIKTRWEGKESKDEVPQQEKTKGLGMLYFLSTKKGNN